MANLTDIELSAIDKAIDDWFVQSFNGGALARATDAYNEVHAAKDKLKANIASLFTPEPSSSPPASA
jgi:hypothetical protein